MKVILIDTETIGLEDITAFDISWIVSSLDGKELEENAYLVKEVWESESVKKAFYYEMNKDKYESMIQSGEIEILSVAEIKERLLKDILRNDVNYISAFNINFDLRSLTRTFIGYGVSSKTITLENLSKFVIPIDASLAFAEFENNSQLYKDFCKKTGNITNAGNVKTTAEVIYKFIKMDKEAKEEHIGIKDCMLELEILQYYYIMSKQNKEFLDKVNLATLRNKKPYTYFSK